jgi:hypothetical protein
MRYILIAKDDATGVLKIVYHNGCKKKAKKREYVYKKKRKKKMIK